MEDGTQVGLILAIAIGLVILTACGILAFTMFVLGWTVV
jgi:hypothetical protein